MTARRLLVCLLLALTCSVLAGCVSPAPTSAAYRAKAEMTAQAAASEVSTVQLTTRLLLDRRLSQPYGDVTVSASEDALSAITQTFEIVQPPGEADDVIRDELSRALASAGDAVSAARISLRRDDVADLSVAYAALAKSTQQLEALAERYA